MKTILIFLTSLVCLFCSVGARAQSAPVIQYSQLYGGAQDDHPGPIVQTPDKGFVIAGWTQSVDGQVVGYHGGMEDGWVVKNDSAGNFLWGKAIGGSGEDICNSLTITPNYYIVGGYYNSSDGDFDTLAHPVSTSHNMGYLAWLDPANGSIKRIKSYSGDVNGEIYGVQALPNGNIILLGRMFQTGQVKNMWIAMLDSVGTILWSKYYGTGSTASNEMPTSIMRKSGGGFVATAQTTGNGGDVTGFHGAADIWILNIDDTGKILWAKCYGGTSGEGSCGAFEASDGGLICAGETQSSDGDVTGFHGGEDYWVFKTDDTGKLLWSTAVGGSGTEFISNMQGTCDGGVIMAGYTNSTDGDVTGLNGPYDLFMVRLDSSGHIVWEHTYGSSGVDYEGRMIVTDDNGYALVGFTGTADIDVSGALHGYGDIWFAKLATDSLENFCQPLSVTPRAGMVATTPSVFPNPTTGILYLHGAGFQSVVNIYDMLGQHMFTGTIISDSTTINLDFLAPGTYFMRITDNSGNRTVAKLIKQ